MPFDLIQLAAELFHALFIEELSSRVRKGMRRAVGARRCQRRRRHHSVRALRRMIHKLPTRIDPDL